MSFQSVYFDYAATTPLDPMVYEAMSPFWFQNFGNSMGQHPYGWEAQNAIEESRSKVAKLFKVNSQTITFTSGATESNNWVLESLFRDHLKSGSPPNEFHFIVSAFEHPSLRIKAKQIEQEGAQLTFVYPNNFGQITKEDILTKIKPETKLISIMWVQNELGIIQPLESIAQLCFEKNILFHTDATQAIGKFDISLNQIPVDFLSASAHKVYGPKGIGLLYKKEATKALSPFLLGGGHENGQRSGTLATPLIVGLGKAFEILDNKTQRDHEIKTLSKYKTYLINELTTLIPNLRVNSPMDLSVPTHLHITFPEGVLPSLIVKVALSRGGSACQSQKNEISPALASLGWSYKEAQNSLRLSLGRMTTFKDIEFCISEFKKIATK